MTWTAHDAGVRTIDDVLSFIGVPIAKRGDSPLTRRGFDQLVRALVTAMQRDSDPPTRAVLRKATERLDRDWPKLSEADRERAFHEAGRVILDSIDRIATAAVGPIAHDAQKAIEATRQATSRTHDLKVEDVFSAADARAAEFARKTAGFFMRQTGGKLLAGAADTAARDVVARAIEGGWDRKRAATEMSRVLAGTVGARQQSYYEVVASVAMARVRSYSQLRAFNDAGIETFTFVAVLDERTSDVCRFMHGRTFSVAAALDRFDDVERAGPGAVVNMQPFVQLGRRVSGSRALFANANGKRTELATIERSAVGTKDDTGDFEALVDDDEIEDLGCCTPPLHPNCRSTLVPGPEIAAQPPPAAISAPTPTPAATPRRAKPLPPAAPSAKPVEPGETTATPALAPGKHFRKLISRISKKRTKAFLEAAGLPWVAEWLDARPLDELVLNKAMRRVNGSYTYRHEGTLELNMGRKADSWGRLLTPGASWSISTTAKSLDEALLRTFVHELGHHMHLVGRTESIGQAIDAEVRKAFAKATPITQYAGTNSKEYFAESLAAYVFERAALQAFDPGAAQMVETVLAMRGITKLP